VIAYLDSSVLLRVVLAQRNALREWSRIAEGVVSALAEVECLRTLDRLRLIGTYADAAIAERREAVYRLLDSMELIEIGHAVLARAAQPLPTALGTLDAIHLASALRVEADELVAYDARLLEAAREQGMRALSPGR